MSVRGRATVTKLRRADHGELEANLSVDGVTVPVTRKFGSWMISNGSGIRELRPEYAAELEKRVRTFERGERA